MSDQQNHTVWAVVGPSATGKSTLVKQMNEELGMVVATSHTTRPPRAGEVQGVDYHFVSEAEFLEIKTNNGFVEDIHYPGNNKRYGITKADIDTKLASSDVVIIVDGQGAAQLLEVYPQAQVIFLVPPSTDILVARMAQRGDRLEDIMDRLKSIDQEVTWVNLAHVVIPPSTIENVFQTVKHHVTAARG